MDDLSKLSKRELALRFLRDSRHTIYLLCDTLEVDYAMEFIDSVLKDYMLFYRSCNRKFCDDPAYFPAESVVSNSN